mgnify:CR=1 FL=1
MSDLLDLFHLKSNKELITIIESTDSYTPEAISAAAEVIQERFLSDEEIQNLVCEFWDAELEKSLKIYLKKGEPPISNFLTDGELKDIFAKKFQEYVERKELLSVDSTIYWFAF